MRCLAINTKARSNIKVYNYSPSRVCVKGANREFEFLGARDGIGYAQMMSFDDLALANSRNPYLFVTGLLTFEESERDEIYCALGHENWRERFWTEESIENALLFPNKAKMERILAIEDILTIERIRGKMVSLINLGVHKPIDSVINLVNERWSELQRGLKRSRVQVALPKELEDNEKKALKSQNEQLQEQLRIMQEQIAALMSAKQVPIEAEAPAKKPAAKKK